MAAAEEGARLAFVREQERLWDEGPRRAAQPAEEEEREIERECPGTKP